VLVAVQQRVCQRIDRQLLCVDVCAGRVEDLAARGADGVDAGLQWERRVEVERGEERRPRAPHRALGKTTTTTRPGQICPQIWRQSGFAYLSQYLANIYSDDKKNGFNTMSRRAIFAGLRRPGAGR